MGVEMENKEFAEKNAGKYFRYKGTKVQVVGYRAYDNSSVIVVLPWNNRGLWWDAKDLGDVFVVRSKARRYWYVNQWELSVWE